MMVSGYTLCCRDSGWLRHSLADCCTAGGGWALMLAVDVSNRRGMAEAVDGGEVPFTSNDAANRLIHDDPFAFLMGAHASYHRSGGDGALLGEDDLSDLPQPRWAARTASPFTEVRMILAEPEAGTGRAMRTGAAVNTRCCRHTIA
jgi:hypothetical protein